MRISLADLPKFYASIPEFKLGCIVDTNALFAAAVPLDRMNEWAEAVFKQLSNLEMPIFTNINIRSEFMELQRRVLIPEGLVTLYDEPKRILMKAVLKGQLKSLKTMKDQATSNGRLFKLNDQQMKKYRSLLIELPGETYFNAWEQFCADYLKPYIGDVWEATIAALKINPLGTQAIESRKHFDRDPNWKDMTDIIGRFGIGSSDAMIINFFLCSRFPMIVTSDEDVAYVVERVSNGSRYVLVST